MTRTHSAIAALTLMLSLGGAATAQEFQMPRADPPPSNGLPRVEVAPENLGDELGRGLESMMNDMFQKAQPHLEGLANDLRGTLEDYRPALETMAALMDDIRNYERPERLPNGDILVRRRAGAPPPPPLDAPVPDTQTQPVPSQPVPAQPAPIEPIPSQPLPPPSGGSLFPPRTPANPDMTDPNRPPIQVPDVTGSQTTL